jgi:hypothetical protein
VDEQRVVGFGRVPEVEVDLAELLDAGRGDAKFLLNLADRRLTNRLAGFDCPARADDFPFADAASLPDREQFPVDHRVTDCTLLHAGGRRALVITVRAGVA